MDEPSNLPAGWYPDMNQPDHERLWTGTAWSDQVRPIPQPSVVEAVTLAPTTDPVQEGAIPSSLPAQSLRSLRFDNPFYKDWVFWLWGFVMVGTVAKSTGSAPITVASLFDLVFAVVIQSMLWLWLPLAARNRHRAGLTSWSLIAKVVGGIVLFGVLATLLVTRTAGNSPDQALRDKTEREFNTYFSAHRGDLSVVNLCNNYFRDPEATVRDATDGAMKDVATWSPAEQQALTWDFMNGMVRRVLQNDC